jgi:hypothetical protein
MSKKPITVYWAPAYFLADIEKNWSYLYPKPQTLFSNLMSNRARANSSYFVCPAVSPKFKRTLIFNFPINTSYHFVNDEDGFNIKALTENYIYIEKIRDSSVNFGPTLLLGLHYIFFAEESLITTFSPPMFSKPKHTKHGAIVPGEFDIGQWFRPFNAEIQTWENSSELHFEENEPLFYVEFKTNRKIELKRFTMDKQLISLSSATVSSKNLLGQFRSLNQKYNDFKNIGMREKVLTQIKKNLIDEPSLILG